MSNESLRVFSSTRMVNGLKCSICRPPFQLPLLFLQKLFPSLVELWLCSYPVIPFHASWFKRTLKRRFCTTKFAERTFTSYCTQNIRDWPIHDAPFCTTSVFLMRKVSSCRLSLNISLMNWYFYTSSLASSNRQEHSIDDALVRADQIFPICPQPLSKVYQGSLTPPSLQSIDHMGRAWASIEMSHESSIIWQCVYAQRLLESSA